MVISLKNLVVDVSDISNKVRNLVITTEGLTFISILKVYLFLSVENVSSPVVN